MYDPAALRARAETFRRLARSWTDLAAQRPFDSAGRLRRTASAALFAAYLVEELIDGGAGLPQDAEDAPATEALRAACERAQGALAEARRVEAQWQARRERVSLPPRATTQRVGDDLRAQLLARSRHLREIERTVEWLRATAPKGWPGTSQVA